MIVVGVDCGLSNVGVAILGVDIMYCEMVHISCAGTSGIARRVRAAVRSIVDCVPDNADHVVVEAWRPMGLRTISSYPVAMVVGGVVSAVDNAQLVDVKQWRKEIGARLGTGDAGVRSALFPGGYPAHLKLNGHTVDALGLCQWRLSGLGVAVDLGAVEFKKVRVVCNGDQ